MCQFDKLVEGAELLESDRVSRYCSFTRYDHDNSVPKLGAFEFTNSDRKEKPPSLSVNRLEHYGLGSIDDLVGMIRQECIDHGPTVRKSGRFIVFQVADAKNIVLREVSCNLVFKYTPKGGKVSHSSIYGIPDDRELERTIAYALKRHLTILHTSNGLLDGA